MQASLATMIVHLVLDGVADGSLGIGLDVIGAAARIVEAGLVEMPQPTKTLRQRVVSLDGESVRSGTQRLVPVDGALQVRALRPGDVLVLPGLSAVVTERAIEGLLVRPDIKQAIELIAQAAAKGVKVAASCSATFVVAASGLLAGQNATTTWWLVPVFARRFPDVTVCADHMVVESEGNFTAGSAFAHADLMLAVVARVASASLSHLVARYLVLDQRPSQSRYMVMEHLRTEDPALRAMERFVVANLERQMSLTELAHAAGTSERTLARRVHAGLGMTPQAFVQRVRVARAAFLLETTQASVEEVASLVGYADATAFRRVFRRHLGESPTETRGLTRPPPPSQSKTSPAQAK